MSTILCLQWGSGLWSLMSHGTGWMINRIHDWSFNAPSIFSENRVCQSAEVAWGWQRWCHANCTVRLYYWDKPPFISISLCSCCVLHLTHHVQFTNSHWTRWCKEDRVPHQNASCFEETPIGDRTAAGWDQYTHSCFHVCLQSPSTESGI